MATETEVLPHDGGFIVSEANGNRSREEVILTAGDLVAGTVLGRITDANTVAAGGSNVGDGAAGAATLGTEALNGTYTLTCTAEDTNAGTFSVVTPLGDALDDLTVAVAYTSSHFNITIADGTEDFDVDDVFTIDVLFGEYAIYDGAASDGTEVAKAILWGSIDASSAEQNCAAMVRDCEVNVDELTFKATATEVHKSAGLAALKTLGIIAR